jgi:hypothetical protein
MSHYIAQGSIILGANTWQEYDATFILNGVPYDGAQFGIVHNGNSCVVIVVAPQARAWCTANERAGG